jgi:hypothetical protein
MALQVASSASRSVGAAILLLVWAGFCTTPRQVAHAEFVDNIVAVVNSEIITTTELDQTAALNERHGSLVPDKDALRAETLNGLITRRLLVQEARRQKFIEVTGREIDAEKSALVRRAGSEEAFAAFLRNIGLASRDLDRMLSEQVLVRKFIEKKFSLFVRISRDEAQQYFDAHRGEFPGKNFSDVQKTITARMADERINGQLDQFLAEIRARADIRINGAGQPPRG